MMIDETSPGCLVHRCVYLAIDLLEQEAFENVEADYEVVDEDDADDQGTKGCQLGNGLYGHSVSMRALSFASKASHYGVVD